MAFNVANKFYSIGFAMTLIATGFLFFKSERGLNLESAPLKVKMDFQSEIRRRGIENNFSQYQQYTLARVDATRFTDKCRLSWIENLVRRPLDSLQSAEQFTSQLYGLSKGKEPVIRILDELSAKLDIKQEVKTGNPPREQNRASEDPSYFLTEKLHETTEAMNRAFRRLSTSEKNELREKIYSQTTTEGIPGYRFGGVDHGARLVELMLRVDLQQISIAAKHLAALTDPGFLQELNRFYRKRSNRAVLREVQTRSGIILMGGDGPNIYNLDESFKVQAVIDFGGDDVYEEGSISAERPVFAIIDLGGNDVYRGKKPGIQGGAILGASLLFDRSGSDHYESLDVAQGSAMTGVGILMDGAGDDRYVGDRRVQGQAINGFGILMDVAGQDQYRGALFAQGVGGPLGTGMLMDHLGADRYFAGGKYVDSYQDSPGFGGWSQGVGVGARDVANGGIGVLLDGSGDDSYEADYFSYGGGYWFGAGFARDFQGNDERWGAVRTNFDGTPRTEERYVRWGTGFGCHYAAGFVFDDRGDDSYRGDWASVAYAWDVAIGALFDGDGNDRYVSEGSGVGEARNAGFALLCDIRGNDRYVGNGLGSARKDESMFSFALFQDRNGRDTFNQPLKNRSRAQRGWAGGLFIDR